MFWTDVKQIVSLTVICTSKFQNKMKSDKLCDKHLNTVLFFAVTFSSSFLCFNFERFFSLLSFSAILFFIVTFSSSLL